MELLSLVADPVALALTAAAGVAPQAASRANAALDIILRGLRCSAQVDSDAWAFSRLCRRGFPVEFACSAAEASVRYTAEIAGPKLAAQERLGRAEQILLELCDGCVLPAELRARIVTAQSDGPLRFGAWLSGRHTAASSRFKLYADLPPSSSQAAGLAHDLLAGSPALVGRQPRLEGLGYEFQAGRVELYYRLEGLDVLELHRLLALAGLAARHDDLLDLVGETFFRPVRPHLPAVRFGFSYALPLGGRADAFSLFAYTSDVFGDDACTRRRLLEQAGRHAWDLDVYAALTSPLADAHDLPPRHTVVAWSVAGQAAPHLSIGLAPPDA